jgi:hypothetical protein
MMSVQSRDAKVFAALLASVTVGAVVLMAMANSPLSVGAFCLSNYNRLDPVEKAVISKPRALPGRWSTIRIYYGSVEGEGGGNADSLSVLRDPAITNCHFVVCDGRFGEDGQIQPTEKWRRQLSITPDRTGRAGGKTIYVCVIAERKRGGPTECQVKRTEALAEELYRTFEISPEFIVYPRDWQ